jgi:hypothetical protein
MQLSAAQLMCCSMCQVQVSTDRGFFGKTII